MPRKAGLGNHAIVTGDRELLRKLRTLPRNVQRNVVKRAVRAGAEVVAATAKEFAPVRTGNLREAIHVREVKTRSPWSVAFEVAVGEGDFKGHQFYAAFIEYGTSQIQAQPFMRPAVEVAGPRATATMLAAVWAGVELEARK